MYYIAKAIQVAIFGQYFLGHIDSIHNTEAKA
jgi:hypothetical protein